MLFKSPLNDGRRPSLEVRCGEGPYLCTDSFLLRRCQPTDVVCSRLGNRRAVSHGAEWLITVLGAPHASSRRVLLGVSLPCEDAYQSDGAEYTTTTTRSAVHLCTVRRGLPFGVSFRMRLNDKESSLSQIGKQLPIRSNIDNLFKHC